MKKESLQVNRVLVRIASYDNSRLCTSLVKRKTEGAVQLSKYLLYFCNSVYYVVRSLRNPYPGHSVFRWECPLKGRSPWEVRIMGVVLRAPTSTAVFRV